MGHCMLIRIYVNHHVKGNKKDKTDFAPLEVVNEQGSSRVWGVTLLGPSRVVYDPHNLSKVGREVFIETEGPVLLDWRKKGHN